MAECPSSSQRLHRFRLGRLQDNVSKYQRRLNCVGQPLLENVVQHTGHNSAFKFRSRIICIDQRRRTRPRHDVPAERLRREHHIDASAAIGIVRRAGMGKLRHLNVRYRWVQDQVKREQIGFEKVAGTDSPADQATKHFNAEVMKKHFERLGVKT